MKQNAYVEAELARVRASAVTRQATPEELRTKYRSPANKKKCTGAAVRAMLDWYIKDLSKRGRMEAQY